MDKWQRFQELCGEIIDFKHTAALLGWDQQVNMPPGGAEERAMQQSTLSRHIHALITSDEVGRLLEELEKEFSGKPYDSDEVSSLREARREYDKATKLPSSLVARLAEAQSRSFQSWVEAKHASDFSIFRPQLENMVQLQKEKAAAVGYTESAYDALLDDYEPDLKRSDVSALFSSLREWLVPFVEAITEKADYVDDSLVKQHFPDAGQWKLGKKALEMVGFDLQNGRIDRAEHPFTTSFSSRDVRITTKVVPTDLTVALFSTLHEAGHGLYEMGIPWRLRRTPLGQAATLSVHESQSRLWENIIGRSRVFWQHLLPVAREIFPSQLSGRTLDQVYRAVNKVSPSLIRVEADEVTYPLHIFLRFEVEQDLIGGSLQVKDLPEYWNEKFQSYLGLVPPDDAHGVLQDVHWSHGLFGYFPTYALGTILSAQLWEAARRDEPRLEKEMVAGRFTAPKKWFGKHVHSLGSKFTTQELAERVTGEKLQVQPYINYIEGKYKRIYDL